MVPKKWRQKAVAEDVIRLAGGPHAPTRDEERAASRLYADRPDPGHPLALSDEERAAYEVERAESARWGFNVTDLADLADARGVTVAGIAEALGVSRAVVYKWLDGPSKVTAFRCLQLRHVLRVTDDVLRYPARLVSRGAAEEGVSADNVAMLWGTLAPADRQLVSRMIRTLWDRQLDAEGWERYVQRLRWWNDTGTPQP